MIEDEPRVNNNPLHRIMEGEISMQNFNPQTTLDYFLCGE